MAAADRQKKLRQRRRLAGLCVACGKVPVTNHTRCENCRNKHNLQSNQRKRNYINAGCCRDCGASSTDYKLCEVCRRKAADSMLSTAHDRAARECCKRCGKQSITAHCPECKKKFKNERQALVREVYEYYGGCYCACCGEDEFLFLTIDHIDNNGSEHRKRLPYGKFTTGVNMARWLKKNSYPNGFQVLCINCKSWKTKKWWCLPTSH